MSQPVLVKRAGKPGGHHQRALAVALAAGLMALLLYFTWRSLLGDLASEDGLIEWLTAIAYFAAAGVFVATAVRRPAGWPWLLVLALLFFGVAGEEISWGQRLFGLETPDAVRDVNVQDEFNLHNVEGLHSNVRLLGVAVFTALYLLPFAVDRIAMLRDVAVRLRFPLPPHWVAGLFAIGLCFMVASRIEGDVIFTLDEVGEIFFGSAALAYASSVHQATRVGAGLTRRAGG